MSQENEPAGNAHQVSNWKFGLAVVIVLLGVSLGTLLIIPRAERGRTRPAKSAPAPFFPKATNQVVVPDAGVAPPK